MTLVRDDRVNVLVEPFVEECPTSLVAGIVTMAVFDRKNFYSVKLLEMIGAG
jgi:hypothetical protein